MKSIFKASLAVAAVAATSFATMSVANAGGIFERSGGSLKDAPMMRHSGGAGRCYVRGDVGYSVSGTPVVNWEVNNWTGAGDDGIVSTDDDIYTFVGNDVQSVEMENAWLGDIGIGCGSGSRGLRGELTLGFRGPKDIDGVPHDFIGPPPPGGPPPEFVDPIHTTVRTYTAMVNAYYDLGRFNNFVPYVGVGIGLAYHKMSETYFTENPFLLNRIRGNNDLTFAWSLMVGTGYQISERAILDIGYRYINLGDVTSDRVDNAGFVNPPVEIKDMDAHEFKIGLRYHFGGTRSANFK